MNTIQSMLYSSIQAHADRKALIDSRDGSVMTYAELYDKAARAAGWLQAQGLRQGDYTVIVLSKNIPYIIAETACFLFGFGAALMDAAYPTERISYVKDDIQAKVVIDAYTMQKMLDWPQKAEYVPVPEDTPAVVIYTSGSTGKPKGILHDQASMYNSLTRRQTILKPNPDDIAGLVPPFTFIAGCVTTMNALTAGACATVIPREVILNPRELALFIDRMGITWTYLSPKVLKVFEEAGHTLRVVVTGSERVSGIGPRRYAIWNTYGMSETCSAVAGFRIDKAYDNTPLGHALEGVKIYLLDEQCNKVNEGEICIAGHLLSKYIGMPEKTAEAIIPNPFRAEDGYETLFRTGDLGKWDEAGRLVFVNRKDWMVKINGQRVEPGEIEAVIKSVPGIVDAAVKGFTHSNGQTYLCAFYVKNRNDLNEDALRMAIARKLPSYMMPAHFVLLDAMPVNANGKMNRLALLEPEADQFAAQYVAPSTPMEERLCREMAGVLGLNRVGINDDFFQIGGDSITSMSLISKLDVPGITVRMIYRSRTPAAIASELETVQALAETTNMDEASRLALKQDQPLIPYQVYYLDYQLYSPYKNILNCTYVCTAPKDRMDVTALREAVDRVTHHFSIFGTVFLFNDAAELVQRYCPELIENINVIKTTEAQFNAEVKRDFVKPFKMMNSLLWRGLIVVTEENVHLLFDISHAIADGTMVRLVLRHIFDAMQGHELPEDRYYLFLKQQAQVAKTPEALADQALLRRLYSDNLSRFPKPDMASRKNEYGCLSIMAKHSFGELQAGATASGISMGTALVTAGLMALSRYNQEKKVAVEWIFNGRDEKWKEDLVGITICGVPATLDFNKCQTREQIIAEAKRQNELGLQYAVLNDALRDMSPAKNESLKIVYEHGIKKPDNVPDYVDFRNNFDYYSGSLCLFQIVLFECAAHEHMQIVGAYQDSRYSEASATKMLNLFDHALNELLLLES